MGVPQRFLRTRSRKRVYVRVPGGEARVHYRREKPSYAKCAACKSPIHGIPRKFSWKLSKSEKTVSRPYGGYLCNRCFKEGLREAVYRMFYTQHQTPLNP